jgi:DNA-binding transcriptional ArsR family regulator
VGVATGRQRADSCLVLDPAVPGVQPVSVHVDPLATVLTSVVEVFGPLSARVPVALGRAVRRAARWVPVPALLDLILGGPDGRQMPDFVTAGAVTFHAQVEQLRQTPQSVLAEDLSVYGQSDSPAARLWERNPEHALANVCSALTLYWRDVITPLYPDLERRLRREAARLDAGLDAYGHETVLALLHPRTRFEHGRLIRPEFYSTGQVIWTANELIVKPMIAAPATTFSNIGSADNPRVTKAFLAVAAPSLRLGWSTAAADASHALELLIGRPRAQILRSVRSRPGTTTDLAHELGLLPSTTSYHLKALRSAGVVTSSRRPTGVYYRLTDRGARLVAI